MTEIAKMILFGILSIILFNLAIVGIINSLDIFTFIALTILLTLATFFLAIVGYNYDIIINRENEKKDNEEGKDEHR